MRRRLVRACLIGIAAGTAAAGCNTLSLHGEALGPPESVAAWADFGGVSLAWSAVPGATLYDVYASSNASWAQAISAADLAGMTPLSSGPQQQVRVSGGDPDVIRRFAIVAHAGGRAAAPSLPIAAGLPRASALGGPRSHFYGQVPGSELGASLAHADLDGDGLDDLVLGLPAPFNGFNDQLAIVRATALGLSTGWGFANGASFQGWSLASGDLDGDGYEDVVSGAPPADFWNPTGTGEASIVRGSYDPIYPYSVVSLPINRPSSGWSVATLADANGDGRDEIAYSFPVLPIDDATSSSGALTVAGEVGFFEASAGTMSQIAAVNGTLGDRFGESIAPVPSFFGPGPEIAVGVPGKSGGGAVELYGWPPAAPLANLNAPPGSPGAFGRLVAPAGDVMGSGPGLLVASQPTNGTVATAYLFAADGSTPAWSADVVSANGGLRAHPSRWLASAGDVDCDGFDDILVGEPAFAGANGPSTGRVSLYLGGTTPAADPVWRIEGSLIGERFGDQVMGEDFDGDGCSDVVVSAPDSATTPGNPATVRGEVWVWRGGARQGLRVDAGSPLRAYPDGQRLLTLSTPGFEDPLRSGSYVATIDWGDGSPPDTLLPGDCADPTMGAFFDCAGHPYPEVGVYRIKVRVDAADGRFGESVTTIEVAK